MTTNLGYGAGLALRQTCRNNHATVDIPKGAPVSLVGAIGTSGVGDDVMLVTLETGVNHTDTLGVAEEEMLSRGTTGLGDWGHVVVFGMVDCKQSADIDADTAIHVKVTTGDFMKATGTQVDAGAGQGKTLADVDFSVEPLGPCFVNFLNRAAAGSSGYDGAET